MPDKIYYNVTLDDGRTEQWSQEDYDELSKKLYEDYPKAQVERVSPYNAEDDDKYQSDTFSVTLDDGREETWSRKDFDELYGSLKQNYPTAQVWRKQDMTERRDRDFVRQYEAAQDRWRDSDIPEKDKMEDGEFITAYGGRYSDLKDKYGRPDVAPNPMDLPQEEPIRNIFQYGWQSVKAMGGHILKGIEENANIILRRAFGPNVKDSDLAGAALAEFDRRVAVGEDPFGDKSTALLNDPAYAKMTKAEKADIGRLADIELLIASRRGEDGTVEDVRRKLEEEAGQRTPAERVGEAADKIIAENSKPAANGWVELGGIRSIRGFCGRLRNGRGPQGGSE